MGLAGEPVRETTGGMRTIGWFLWAAIVCVSILGSGCSMNVNQESFADYPRQVQVGVQPQRVYVQEPGFYTVHYAQSARALNKDGLAEEALASGAVAVMEAEAIAIFPDTVARNTLPIDGEISPVYRLQSGSIAIPTGRVFVRFAETIAVDSRYDAIQAAGYEIVDRPAYAPQAAWVQARSGNIADSLKQIAQLATIPGIENVEPQMLMQRSLR